MFIKKIFSIAFVCVVSVQALPILQLDAVNGTYDSNTETDMAGSNSSVLRALLNDSKYVGQDFYISLAITPQQELSSTVPDFGTIVFADKTFESSDFVYGVPPIENGSIVQYKDAGDLPTHSIFPTYYTEYKFKFDDSKIAAYNVQDNSTSSGTLFYKDFLVDISNIKDGYAVHFDLYNEAFKRNSDIDIKLSAPFSHDAGAQKVPEPTTISLIAISIVGLCFKKYKS